MEDTVAHRRDHRRQGAGPLRPCPRGSRTPRSPCSTPRSRSRRPRSTPRSRSTDPTQIKPSSTRKRTCCARWSSKSRRPARTSSSARRAIDDLVQHFLAKEKIYAVSRVKKSDMEKLAKATGANIVTKVGRARGRRPGIRRTDRGQEDPGRRDVLRHRLQERRRRSPSSSAAAPTTSSTRSSGPWTTHMNVVAVAIEEGQMRHRRRLDRRRSRNEAAGILGHRSAAGSRSPSMRSLPQWK